MMERKEYNFKAIIILYFVAVLIRSILAMQDKVILIYPDELSYIDPARSFMQKGIFSIHNINLNWEPVLYALLLAPFTLIKNSYIQVKVLSFINCMLMCSAIFPAYMLSNKMLKKSDNILIICMFVMLHPELSMTQYFMAENVSFPLSVWLFYFIYLYVTEQKKDKRLFYTCLVSFVCFLLYLCKSVTLGYAVGIVMMEIFQIIRKRGAREANKQLEDREGIEVKHERKKLKADILELLVFGVLFLFLLVGYKYYIYATSDVIGNIYDDKFNSLKFLSYKEFLFLGFCVLSYGIYTLIGFFYFPIVYTGVSISESKSENKNLYVFSVSSLIAIIAAVLLICNLQEDLFEDTIRIHMRYYAPLSILFTLLFLKVMEEQRAMSLVKKKIFLGITMLCACFMLFLLRVPKYGCDLDSFLIFYYKITIYKIASWTGQDPVNSCISIVSMLLILCFIMFFAINLCSRKRRRIVWKVGVCLVGMIFIIDNLMIAGSTFASQKYNNMIKSAVAINDYFQNINGNILVLCEDGFDQSLDTYFSKMHYTIQYEQLMEIAEQDHGVWKINERHISAYYPWHTYEKLNEVNYIIIPKDTSIEFSEEGLEKIVLDGAEQYVIYKNCNPEELKIKMRRNS